jgi:YegS/Rv2252/BmrU family lipid kinase
MPADRTLLIVNPAARHGETAKLLPAVQTLLGSLPHDTVVTQHTGHAAEIAGEASGYDLVVAMGGDGTVHEVLNGLMRIPAEARPTLGVLPTGSGNDTRRTLDIPTDLAEAARVLLAGEVRAFDVGLCNGVYFNNSFAAGMDAKVTAKAVEYKITKERSGLWLYLTALLYVLFNDLGSFPLRVSWEGADPVLLDTLIIAITNGPTYGGGFYNPPDAVADDGLFEVCTIDPLGLPEALVRLPFVILGKHTKMRPVHMSRHSEIVIECDDPVPAQIDGEVLMERRYEISMLAGAVRCIVPRRES